MHASFPDVIPEYPIDLCGTQIDDIHRHPQGTSVILRIPGSQGVSCQMPVSLAPGDPAAAALRLFEAAVRERFSPRSPLQQVIAIGERINCYFQQPDFESNCSIWGQGKESGAGLVAPLQAFYAALAEKGIPGIVGVDGQPPTRPGCAAVVARFASHSRAEVEQYRRGMAAEKGKQELVAASATAYLDFALLAQTLAEESPTAGPLRAPWRQFLLDRCVDAQARIASVLGKELPVHAPACASVPPCPRGWVAVYPCGSKLDLCGSDEDRPAAFFASPEHARGFGSQRWPNTYELRPSEWDMKPQHSPDAAADQLEQSADPAFLPER